MEIIIKLNEFTVIVGKVLNVRKGSDTNGPRKAVPNNNCVRMGIRIHPLVVLFFFNVQK